MRVLVWESYGNVHVFAADTPMHFFKIHERLVRAMEGWGEDQGLKDLFERMGTVKSQKQCEREFQGFVSRHVRTHETFETFEFTELENA
jgi:hypothetical protein